MSKKLWVVTTEYNEYDQYGAYLVAAYLDKPTFKQLKDLLGLDDVTTGKLTRGGGRHDLEHQWYRLSEINEGEIYDLN